MNENDTPVVEQEQINEEVETVEEQPIVEDKPIETPQAKIARLKRQLKKAQHELGVEEEADFKVVRKPKELDRGDKAYLVANGIKGQDEFDLVKELANDTGKDLEELIETKYFQAQLKELRSFKNSKMASDAASGSNRGQASPRDTVDYWVAKGELPPPHMGALRREVVNAKIKLETDSNHFTSTPVIS